MTVFRSLGARKDATRGTTALEVRKDLGALFESEGIVIGSSNPLVVGTAAFSYTVNAGWWVTSRGASDGFHVWGNDGPVTLTTDDVGATLAAPGAGTSRIDIIYARQQSASENGDAVSTAAVAVKKGTAASSPVAPTLPVGALELARNTMTSAATSTSSAGNTLTLNTARIAPRGAPQPSWPLRTLQTASGQSIPNNVWTGVAFGAGTLPGDTGNGSGVSVSGSTWTFSKAGIYSVFFFATFGATSTTGTREARLMLNGSTQLDYDRQFSSNPQGRLQCMFTGAFAAGDTLSCEVNQTSGGALALITTTGANRVDINYVRSLT